MLSISAAALAELPPGFLYDEDKVAPYTLPAALEMADGTMVKSPEQWRQRRGEILKLFETHIYGRTPGKLDAIQYKIREIDRNALGGVATRKQITVLFDARDDGPRMDLLVYLPNQVSGPVPVFLGLNFDGNQTVHPDPKIALCHSWVMNKVETGITEHIATEGSRGTLASGWPIEKILQRGYGLATACCADIAPDSRDGFPQGVHPLFYKDGQTKPAADEWGMVGAWAWGLSRAVDYLETDPDVNARQVALMGHSRLGKTALWAGAQDQRFAIVISNESGCLGAAISRRKFGETVAQLHKNFPHWTCENCKLYDHHEENMPVDQHELLALVAPRPLYVCSASEDLWADPRGEFLAAKSASAIYEFLGVEGLPAKELPEAGQGVMGTVGYHLRPGPHDITEYDWARFLDFADLHFKKK